MSLLIKCVGFVPRPRARFKNGSLERLGMRLGSAGLTLACSFISLASLCCLSFLLSSDGTSVCVCVCGGGGGGGGGERDHTYMYD